MNRIEKPASTGLVQFAVYAAGIQEGGVGAWCSGFLTGLKVASSRTIYGPQLLARLEAEYLETYPDGGVLTEEMIDVLMAMIPEEDAL